MNVLDMHGVARSYGVEPVVVQALRPTDLSVAAGELVAVMGPSGSGKSTLLALAGGLEAPSAGQVVVEGESLGRLKASELARMRRRHIGYVFQDLNLVPALSAAENVMLPRELDGVRTRQARRDAESALALVGMQELSDRFPDTLSGGQQQRVAIARALVGGRRLLLADEPTGALDSVSGEQIMRVLRARCDEGAAVMLVTHDARHAGWADRVVFLEDGAVVATSDPILTADALLSGS